MSSLQTDGKADERSQINTSIRKDIFDDFKRSCKAAGVPMNVLLETFMRQFNEGGFYLTFKKDKKNRKDIEMEMKDAD